MIELSARYYDGVSSRAHAVTLRLDDAGLVHVDGLPTPQSHALGALRISPRLGNTVRSIELPNGAKCESDAHEALDELERRAGRGRANALIYAIESSWRWVAIAALALIVGSIAGIKWGVPLAAQRIARAVPPAMAYDIGRGALAALDQGILKPSSLPTARQTELGEQFARMAHGYPALPLGLVYRSGVGPNAFALPDGTVVVTDELVGLAHDDNEILSVLAHEIGHVHHRHALRMALESSSIALLASVYLGDVTQLTALSAALPSIYAQARYSREHESEADAFAFEYLKQNHIPPRSFSKILRALTQAAGPEPSDGLQYLSSHPPTAERIQRFEVGAQ